MKNLFRIIKLVVPNNKKEFLIFFILSLPVYIIPMLMLSAEKQIIDIISISNNDNINKILILILSLFILYSIMKLLDGISKRYLEFGLFYKVLLFLGKTQRIKLRKLKLENYESSKTYQKIELAQESTDYIAFTLSTIAFVLLFLVSILSISVYLVSLQPFLLILMVLLALSVYLDIYQESLLRAELARDTVNEKRIISYMLNILSNTFSKDIKVNGAGKLVLDKFRSAHNRFLNISSRNSKNIFKKSLVISFVKFLIQGFTYILLFRMFMLKIISIAEFTATFTAFAVISEIMNQLFQFIGNLAQYSILGNPYFELLDLDEADDNSITSPEMITNSFEFEDVEFTYPNSNKTVLEGVSFNIKKGESVAIAGINGAGKSTIIKLMLGYYKPTKGRVLINGKCTTELSEIDITKSISSVFQNFGKYKFSICDNIHLSDPNDSVRLDNIDEALKWASLENKYELNTMLGKEFGGIELSGGDWQRLALARSYYRKRKTYIFDEPTSALDPIFEVEIFKKIESFTLNNTSILVSHRLGALKNVDQIIILNNKKIEEIGTFTELLNRESYFYDLWKIQKAWYK